MLSEKVEESPSELDVSSSSWDASSLIYDERLECDGASPGARWLVLCQGAEDRPLPSAPSALSWPAAGPAPCGPGALGSWAATPLTSFSASPEACGSLSYDLWRAIMVLDLAAAAWYSAARSSPFEGTLEGSSRESPSGR